MEIGAYSFGDTQRNPDGTSAPDRPRRSAISSRPSSTPTRPGWITSASANTTPPACPRPHPGAIVAAAAAATKQIKLGSGASIISTDDPVRVFQQFATADAISGGGRMEITAGRGSSVETFPLFGYDLNDYDGCTPRSWTC